ncbi:hypothetical protein Poli38472_004954 [Pythium oligandrum]|uniref:Uncharacterized protein n=1 Tax=Pythium oligandrum TaxID=41045 RepID=A0A8K1CBR0_PYTOL|nr:hypothetical protein Poli38472_004954 [Pythium oligandrum]|eukprot:TMW59885.1 hypothetical protein Poli38472_004954 [Pythium oligandrum]
MEDEEVDSLHAALALIDALETGDNASTEQGAGGGIADQAPEEEKPAKRRKAASKSGLIRDKEEIQELRRQIQELEDTLHALQEPKSVENGPVFTSRRLAVMYEAMAKRQRRSLKRAEADNATLRQQIDSQMHATHTCLTNGENNMFPKRLISSAHGIFSEETTKLTRSIRLEDLYGYTEAAFSAPCFNDGSESFRLTQLHDENEMVKIIEVQDGWVVPYSVETTDKALWHLMSERSYWEESAYDLHFEKNGDVATADYRATAAIGHLLFGGFQGKYSMQRFPSSKTAPSIVITSFIAEPIETTEQTPGVTVYELAWLRVQEMPVVVDGKETSFTRVHSSRRARIDGGALPPSGRRATLAAVTKLVIDEGKYEFNWRQGTLEAILLRSHKSVQVK